MSFATLWPLPLFAAADPTWTDKEVLYAVGSALGVILTIGIGVVTLIWRHLTAEIRRQNRDLKAENVRFRKELDQKGATDPQIKKELADAKEEIGRLETLHKQAIQKLEQVQTLLQTAEARVVEHQDEVVAEKRRVDRALQYPGKTWNERVSVNAPDFKRLSLDGRRTPIISVLNLKGGVGKTTVTANLAAAFSSLGYRVLALDLDLQGSLSNLLCPEDMQNAEGKKKKLLENFLNASYEAEFPNLLEFSVPIFDEKDEKPQIFVGKSSMVPTSDQLAYAEMRLMVRWLLRDGNRDPRFLLRRELHLKRISGAFDVVLMDCPPLINVCCVNALAASDYLLIPVLPSTPATSRVPVLLDILKDFRENVNPDLKLLGVLANRTTRAESLTQPELNKLAQLDIAAKDAWGEVVPRLGTFIPQTIQVRDSEDGRRPPTQADALFRVFVSPAEEIQKSMPSYCRPKVTAASQEVN